MKNLSIIYLVCACFIVACSNDYNDPETEKKNSLLLISKDNAYTISSDEAKRQAINMVVQLRSSTRMAIDSEEVESVIPWRSKDIWAVSRTRESVTNILDTALYIVNMKDNAGYALVSADSRVPGVMAFIEKGSLYPNSDVDNPGFRLFLNKLEGYFIEELQKASNSDRGYNDPYFVFSVNVEPMLTTNWGQDQPYNKYCFTQNGLQAAAGCTAIAIAQIVAYYQWPESFNGHIYDWNSILADDVVHPTDTTASNSVGHLVHDIGTLINTSYGVDGSGASFDNVEDCWDAFDYGYVYRVYPTFEAVDSTLQSGMPVLYGGMHFGLGGHAWVIDGSAVRRGFIRIFGPSGTLSEVIEIQHLPFVHCNWGWDGYNNGYFLFGAFQSKYNEATGTITDGTFAPNNWNESFLWVFPC